MIFQLQLEKKKLVGKASTKSKVAPAPPSPTPVETPKPRIVFQFTLDKIVAVLYMGEIFILCIYFEKGTVTFCKESLVILCSVFRLAVIFGFIPREMN